jgi:phosphotriesterase-related protein
MKCSEAELSGFKKVGGGTIVDAQPVGCGRNAVKLKELSERSGVNIIASTGFHKLIYYPRSHWIYEMSQSELTDLFANELVKGMHLLSDIELSYGHCDATAGIIKTAFDDKFDSEYYKKLFGAAVNAAKECKAPVMVHIDNGTDPLKLARWFETEGMELTKLIFCHMDRAVPDLNVHEVIARCGIFLEYDTVARYKYHDDGHEVKLIMEMIERGFADNILMGLDTTRLRLSAYGGAPGLTFLKQNFVPYLTGQGASESDIDKIFFQNPKRALKEN